MRKPGNAYTFSKVNSIAVTHITPQEAVFLFRKRSYAVKAFRMQTT